MPNYSLAAIARCGGWDRSFLENQQQAKGSKMSRTNIKFFSAVLVLAGLTISQAQAGGRGSPNLGSSSFAPGHGTPVVGDPGKSGNAPGDIKNDKDLKDAKSLAPGSMNPNKK
jgi:hypothetical protein